MILVRQYINHANHIICSILMNGRIKKCIIFYAIKNKWIINKYSLVVWENE